MLLDPNPNAEIDVDVSLYIPTAEDAVQSSEFSQPIVGSSAEFLTELIDDVQNSRSAVLRQETNDEADIYWLAIPTINERLVSSIVVIRYSGVLSRSAALELWQLSDGRAELSLHHGCYGPMSHFRAISEHVHFPIGVGLPGTTWKMRQPRMLTPLGTSPEFVRAANAEKAGLESGIGFPVLGSDGELDSVLLLLASHEIPFAARFEIWTEEADGLVQLEVLNAPRPAGHPSSWDGDKLRETIEDLIYEAFEQRQAVVETLPVLVTEAPSGPGESGHWRAIVLPVLAEKQSALVFWIA